MITLPYRDISIIAAINNDNFIALLDALELLTCFNEYRTKYSKMHREIVFYGCDVTKALSNNGLSLDFKNLMNLNALIHKDESSKDTVWLLERKKAFHEYTKLLKKIVNTVNNYAIPDAIYDNLKIVHYATLRKSTIILKNLSMLGVNFNLLTVNNLTKNKYTPLMLNEKIRSNAHNNDDDDSRKDRNTSLLLSLQDKIEKYLDSEKSNNCNNTSFIQFTELDAYLFALPIMNPMLISNKRYYGLIYPPLDNVSSIDPSDNSELLAIIYTRFSNSLYGNTDYVELKLRQNIKYYCAIDLLNVDNQSHLTIIFKKIKTANGYISNEFILFHDYLSRYEDMDIFTPLDSKESLKHYILSQENFIIRHEKLDTTCKFTSFIGADSPLNVFPFEDQGPNKYIAITLTSTNNTLLMLKIIQFLYDKVLIDPNDIEKNDLYAKLNDDFSKKFQKNLHSNLVEKNYYDVSLLFSYKEHTDNFILNSGEKPNDPAINGKNLQLTKASIECKLR